MFGRRSGLQAALDRGFDPVHAHGWCTQRCTEDVKGDAIALVATYCATTVPSEHDDKIRIEYKVRGNTITIYECRPPWREDFGPGWTSCGSARCRLDYPSIDPAPSVLPLLGELENDPTCIFWG